MKEYDIAIIGAGPSGSMLARLLENSILKIAIFDARPLDRAFKTGDLKKSCGGLIAPDAGKFLDKNGIKIPQNVISSIQSKWVKTIDLNVPITRTYIRDYVNVDREAFDRFLASEISADKYFSYRVRTIESDNGYVINKEIRARILVGADGASSMVRKKFFPKFSTREYVSVQEAFAGGLAEDFECYFDKKYTDYYGWRFTKEEGSVLGLAIPKTRNAQSVFNKFKKDLKFGEPLYREGAVILRPKLFHPVLCKDNLFLIGEAGGYISPSSAEGFSFAFKTAKILADSNFDKSKFKRKMLVIQTSILLKNIKSFFMYNPFMRFIIMSLSIRKNPTKDKTPKALDKLQKVRK